MLAIWIFLEISTNHQPRKFCDREKFVFFSSSPRNYVFTLSPHAFIECRVFTVLIFSDLHANGEKCKI